jgi:hypothetical protein
LSHSLLFAPFYFSHFFRGELIFAETTHFCFKPNYLGTTRAFLIQASATAKAIQALVGCLLAA